MKYQGLYTAIVTPFKDGKVDYDAFKALIEAQIAGGVDGIVPMGTTGESPTVSTEEHLEVIRVCIETVAGRCQVIAGTGANCTAEAIELTKARKRCTRYQKCRFFRRKWQTRVGKLGNVAPNFAKVIKLLDFLIYI